MSNNKEISGQSSWDPILLRYDYTFGDFYVGQKFFNETVPVIPIDTDGLQWILIDSVGFHPTNRFHRNPSNNISAFSDVHLTSDTLSRHDFRLSHFRWRVSGIEFCLFNWKKKVFHRNLSVCIGHIWRFSFIFPIACYRLRIGTRQLFLRHACKVCRQQLTSHMNYLWKVVRSTSHMYYWLYHVWQRQIPGRSVQPAIATPEKC